MALSQLIFPIASRELTLEVMVTHTGKRVAGLLAAGAPVPPAVWANAQIDTGTNVSCVAPRVLKQLGLSAATQRRTQTMAGQVSVNLFEVSLTITAAGRQGPPSLIEPNLTVIEMPTIIPGVEFLVGMDVLLNCKLLLDGPAQQFTLEF